MEPNDVFIGAFDYARGGTDLQNPTGADDFSLATWRIRHPYVDLVNIYRKSGIDAAQASSIIHEYDMKLNYKLIVADPGGGGIFVRDELRKPYQDTGIKRFPVTPIIHESDLSLIGVGKAKLVFFKRGEPSLVEHPPVGINLEINGESWLINKAHDVLKTGIEKKIFRAPAAWKGWGESGMGFANADQMRKFLNRASGLTELDRMRAEMDLAFMQLISVDRQTDKEGNPEQDKFGNYIFKSKRKKDAAYAIVYGYFGVWLYLQLEALRAANNVGGDGFMADAESVNVYG